ncbi:MAG: GntR family transcriptional regulator [Sphaerochaetaceae bacterium]|nr:GntR family transcriptional regulator [Spirochaetales bacterium]MDY5498881.1 GntR family transcriptional regulator [Sphaerochaetaceae bacterium]
MAVTRKEEAYALVKGQILDGTLKPGDIVSERAFIQTLGYSRTPVHEAVTQLAEEGLVKIMPSRGMVVAPISVGDITMVYQARSVIEPAIVRLLAETRGLAVKDEVEEAMKRQMGDEDSAFHCALAQLAGNSYLLEMERKLMTQCQRIRVLSNKEDPAREALARSEHQAILEAIQQKEGGLACKQVLHHLSRTVGDYQHIFSTSTAIQL